MKSEGKGRIADREQRVEWLRGQNLFSNVFMSVALREPAACQHVLRTLLDIPSLAVHAVRTRYHISNLRSKDSELDVLAEDASGKMYNIEIQRADTEDHARRVRYYGALIDSEFLAKGGRYQDLPNVYLLYVSETDFWKRGLTACPIQKSFPDRKAYEDGMQILYVNAAVDDGSERARLMRYFRTTDPEDQSQGALSARVRFLKIEEGGYREMEAVVEEIFQDGVRVGREEGREEGLAEGVKSERRETAFRLLARGAELDEIIYVAGASPEQAEQWIREWKAGQREKS